MSGDVALVREGVFRLLDVELTLRIFASLDLMDRLRCVSEARERVGSFAGPVALLRCRPRQVCKGWRSLRCHPALWASLSLTETDFSAAGVLAFVTGPRSPLPSPACVQTLQLYGDGGVFDAKTLKAVLKTLSSATSVSLRGKKLSKDTVCTLAKPRDAPLTALKLGRLKDSEAAVLEILAVSPSLTELDFGGILSDTWMDAAGARAAAARGGGVPLLTTLTVGANCYNATFSGLTAEAFTRLGTAFPELARLQTDSVHGLDHAYVGNGGFAPAAPLRAWAPMPALRELRVGKFSKLVIESQMQDFLVSLTQAAPNLRVLKLNRGFEAPSQREIDVGAPYVGRPMLGGPDLSGIGMLQQLEHLDLDRVGLNSEDATVLDLPKLKSMSMSYCSPHDDAATAAAIAAAAPRLQSLRILRTGRGQELDGTAALNMAKGFANLASASLTKLSVMMENASGEVLGSMLRDLAARNALPALRTLLPYS